MSNFKTKFMGAFGTILNAGIVLLAAILAIGLAALAVFAFVYAYRLISLSMILGVVCIAQFIVIAVLTFYVRKFAILVMICEDDYGEVIETLEQTEKSVQKMLSLQMFFDSIEIKRSVDAIIDEVRMNRVHLITVMERFINKSKQKYEISNAPSNLPNFNPEAPDPLEAMGIETDGRQQHIYFGRETGSKQ